MRRVIGAGERDDANVPERASGRHGDSRDPA
jgi:hypothetical protein